MKKKYYSEKEVDEIINRACEALSNLSVPKKVEFSDRPFFNGRETYNGWREYLLTGNIDNEYTKQAIEKFS